MNDFSKILIQAKEDVKRADLPDDLREAAFKEAIRLRATAAGVGPEEPERRPERPTPPANSDALDKIAERLRVPKSALEDVLDEHDGELDLIIGARKLPSSTQAGAQSIALLVASARQAAEIEEWTSVDTIRKVCEDFKKYDSANFAKSLSKMDDFFRMRGRGQKREFKLARPGWDAAGDLVRDLTGGDE